MHFLETHQLAKHYGDVRALQHCSLHVDSGEVFGLLGPNGAGKSTLLRLLMGFLRPSAGWARIAGHDCYQQSVEVHRQVAYLPGDVRLFRGMHARQMLQFFTKIRGITDTSKAEAIAEHLDLRLDARVSQMSTGMRQKLALAVTLAAETPLVILDEPTANLDPNVRAKVGELVRAIREEGRSVLFSSHVLSEVEETCDRVAILRQGELVHEQLMSELKRQHRIFASLTAPLPDPPTSLRDELTVHLGPNNDVLLETPGDLKLILEWLSTAPLREMRIEPVGLRVVYDRFHRAALDASSATKLPC